MCHDSPVIQYELSLWSDLVGSDWNKKLSILI